MNDRRRKIVPLTHRLLCDILTMSERAITIRCTEGLPADARMVGHGYDYQRDAHYLVFESDEWEPVEDFAAPPMLIPQFTRWSVAPLLEQAAELLINARAEEMSDRDYAAAVNSWLRDYEQFRGVLE